MVSLRGVLQDQVDAFRQALEEAFGEDEAEEEEEGTRYGTFRIESISPNLVVIPATDEPEEIDVRYPLIEPFADAHVYWDDDDETLVYEVDEPDLNEREATIFDELKDALEEKLDVPLTELETTEEIVDYLEKKMDAILRELGYQLNDEERNKIMYYIYRNFAGLNEIEPLMHDPYIEDIGCSGTDIPIYIVHSKFGSIKTEMVFHDEDKLRDLVVKLAERANKYVSYAEPLLDGTLTDGSRVNASLTKDVTTKGPTFSIRKFQEVPMSAVDLLELGTASLDILAYMWIAMEYQKSLLVIGGTATGKTTFLNACVTFIPPEQKIVSIEDTRELQLPHENWIPSVTRTGVGMEADEVDISMYQLLRESFRQNPDYVIVGEVRGEEASVLFQGMASGHPSISTMHASSPYDVISRLTTPPINLSPALVETLDFIVAMTHAQEIDKNARRVQAIFEIEDISKEGSPRTNEYASWVPIDDTYSIKEDSTVLDNIQQQFGVEHDELRQEIEDRKKVLDWMHENGYANFNEVARIVSEYYKNKEQIMKAVSESAATRMEDVIASGAGHGTGIEERQQMREALSTEAGAEEEELFGGVGHMDRDPFSEQQAGAGQAAVSGGGREQEPVVVGPDTGEEGGQQPQRPGKRERQQDAVSQRAAESSTPGEKSREGRAAGTPDTGPEAQPARGAKQQPPGSESAERTDYGPEQGREEPPGPPQTEATRPEEEPPAEASSPQKRTKDDRVEEQAATEGSELMTTEKELFGEPEAADATDEQELFGEEDEGVDENPFEDDEESR